MGKILVIRGGAIGDFILTLPAIRLIAEGLPQAEIEIMGYDPIIALAPAGGYATRTRSIEYGPMASFFAHGTELDPELCKYFAGFDVVVSYLYDPDHFFRDSLTKAGVETLIECSHRIDHEGAPAAAQLAQPLAALALFLDAPQAAPELTLNSDIHVQGIEFLGPHADHPSLIGIHPGSGSPYKNWALERWLDLMIALSTDDPNVHFVLATGEAEDENVMGFLAEAQARQLPIISAASLPLPVLGAVLARCCLFLGHDSGISHLAAAVGTETIALFGPTMSAVWAPQNPHVQIIEHPSGLLSELTVDEVFKTARTSLAQSSRSQAVDPTG